MPSEPSRSKGSPVGALRQLVSDGTPSQFYVVVAAVVLAIAALTAVAGSASAQSPTAEQRPPEIYLPASDLDAVLGREKRGVLLPRSQFEDLLKKAAQTARETPDVPNGITVVSADYQGRIVGTQLLIAAAIKLNQVADGWRFLRLPLSGIALESASLDGQPALLGAKGSDQTVHLFSDRRGPHTLVFAAAAALAVSGGDREAAFRLGDLPVGTLSLEVPANQRLLVQGRVLERPSPLDKPATYSFPVGGRAEIRLRLTDRSLEHVADPLLLGDTTYRLNVSYGDATWQATTRLDARGTAIGHVVLGIPDGLRITAVEATGLDSWTASAAAVQKPAALELSFRQPFTGKRTIQIRGVLRPGADRHWRVEPLKIQGASAHVGHIEVAHAADLRLRIESEANLRPAVAPDPARPAGSAQDVTPELPKSDPFADPRALPTAAAQAPNAPSPARPSPTPPAAPALRYDAWNEQFSLVFTVEAKQRQVLADLLTSLEISPSGLELRLATALQSLDSPVFDVELTLPAEWTPTALLVGQQPAEWREISAEAGVQHLLVTLPNPVGPGVRVPITLAAQKTGSTWPIDETGIEVALPEVRVMNTAAVSGSYVIRAPDDFELTPSDVKGLDPAHLNLPRERIGFRYQDTRFSGKLKVARRPARLSAETLLVTRLDRAALRTRLRTTIEARGGGFRRLDILLPESVSKDVRFQTDQGEAALADQSVAGPAHGERHWTLVFAKYVHGTVHLSSLIETPRGGAKEFRVPEPRFEGVARHGGTVVVQAAPDQQLQVTAVGADKQPLREVDLADLPPLSDPSDDRTVGAYRFVQPDNRVTLTETRYAPIGVVRAVCTRCEIETVVPVSGECQHAATFHFLASGVQNVRVTLPEGAHLWATLVDGQPVEVRRGQSGYELPLKPAPDPNAERVLQVFYATPSAAGSEALGEDGGSGGAGVASTTRLADQSLGGQSRFQQAPPEVSVVGGGGAPERMEVLHRAWTLHYPNDLTVAESAGAFRPDSTWIGSGLLKQLVQDLGTLTAIDAGWKLLEFLGVVVVAWLCVRGYVRWGAKGIVTACVAVGVVACAWMVTLMFSGGGESATFFESDKTAAKSEGTAFARAYPWNRALQPQEMQQAAKEEKKTQSLGVAKGGRTIDGMDSDDADGLGGVRGERKTPLNSAGNMAAPAPPQQAAPQPAKPADRPARAQGLLSVAIGFEPQQNTQARTFEYIGREAADGPPPSIDVQFESLAGRRVFCGAIVAVVTFLLWFVRRRSWQLKGVMGAIGLLMPIALAGVIPVGFEVWLDGIFLGTLCGVAAWLLYGLPGALGSLSRPTSGTKAAPPLNAVGTTVLLVCLLVAPSSVRAQQRPTAGSKTSRAIVAPVPRPNGPAVIPYDPDKNPTAADRVLLEQRTYLQLWNRAYPARPIGLHPLADAFVTEALYKASVVANEQSSKASATQLGDRGRVSTTGRLALYSSVEHPVILALPFFDAAIKSARLDGKPALLIPHRGAPVEKLQRSQFDIVLPSAGPHALEVELEVPARIAGPSGDFTLKLLPVASGRLSFELPQGAATVRLNGADAGFRRRADGHQDWIDVPIASAGEFVIAWQPAQEAGSVARSIESESKSLLALDDAGLHSVSKFSLQIRQGSVSELSFGLPANSKLTNIRGVDVAGWKIEGADPARKLVVSLRHSVTGATGIELDLYEPVPVGESAQPLAASLPSPNGVVRETGVVAFAAGPQFDVRDPKLASGSRIESRDFDVPAFANGFDLAALLSQPVEAVFRYTSRPAPFQVTVARRSSQTDVAALYGVLVGRRKLTLSSKFHVQPNGLAQSRAQFRLPAGFLTLAVEGSSIADWYVSGVAGAQHLIVEFASPQSSPFDLVISGTVAKNPDDAKAALDVPTLANARRAEAQLAVWVDGSYQATIGEAADWKSVSPDQSSPEIKALLSGAPRFAFESRRPEPSAISLDLAHAVPRLTGDSATIVTVTDAAVFYTVALQWSISQATADTFVVTLPDWLASRLDLTDPVASNAGNPRRRETVSTLLGNGRVRWSIELQEPVADQLFLTATAVLPLPKDGKVIAPAIGLEADDATGGEHRFEPLGTQRHFVVVVNQSAAQLAEAPANPIEAVDRGSLPIQLDGQLLKQAIVVGRVTRPDPPATWRLDRPSVRRGAGAFVNLADLVTVIESGGTWRTQATYRVKNLSRQFLPVEIPEGSEILSVLVKQEPARAVRADLGGKSLNLVPLPEASEGDLSFDVRLIIGGRLPDGSLPDGVQLAGQKVPLVAPQVVPWDSTADYGIPVARTRWTVWFPADQQVRVLTSPQETNLDRADETTATFFEQSALLDEAKQLLSVIETGPRSKSGELAFGNLSRINGQLNSESASISGRSTSAAASESDRQSAQSMQQEIEDVQKRIRRESSLKSQVPKVQKELTPEAQSDQARDLFNRNDKGQQGQADKQSGEIASKPGFGFRIEASSEEASKSTFGPRERNKGEKEQISAVPALDRLLHDESESPPASQNGMGRGKESKKEAPALGLGQFGAPIFGNGPQGPAPVTAPPEQASHPHSPGTLSLAFDIPKEGQALVFTKAGGDPRLTVELRPRKSLELLWGAIWMLPWLFVLLLVLALCGRAGSAPAARRRLPYGLIVLGLLLFVALPAPASFIGLVLVAVGTAQVTLAGTRRIAGR